MDQEHRFLLALDDTSGFEIKGDSLTLYGTGGQARLVFEAVYLQ